MDEIISHVRERLKSADPDPDGVCRPKLLKPARGSDLAADEARLGFNLPPLLKRLYAEVGNGGFGPGYGLIGMSFGVRDWAGKTAPEIYLGLKSRNDPEDPSWRWPDRLLPVCDWGCAIASCIDCSPPHFPMRIFDPNVHRQGDPWSDAFFDDAESFDAWIGAWADGIDLWQRSYGENGKITLAVAQRNPAR